VRPIAVATCDLDGLIVAGTSPFPAPFPIGHECVAEVIEIGNGVTTIRPGQLVSVPFQISCGDCVPCRRRRTGNCSSVPFMSTYGFGPAVEREQPRLPLLEMYTTGVTFSTGRVHARPAIPHVLELTARGALHPERITTRTVSWNDALDALTASRWTKLVFCRE
jgi:threonine dehydrogenase-like Zn-dependent dehydrogenase